MALRNRIKIKTPQRENAEEFCCISLVYLDCHKELAGLYGGAILYHDLVDDTGHTSNNRCLHLHCFDDSKYLVFLNNIAGLYVYLGNHTGDRRTNLALVLRISKNYA